MRSMVWVGGMVSMRVRIAFHPVINSRTHCFTGFLCLTTLDLVLFLMKSSFDVQFLTGIGDILTIYVQNPHYSLVIITECSE